MACPTRLVPLPHPHTEGRSCQTHASSCIRGCCCGWVVLQGMVYVSLGFPSCDAHTNLITSSTTCPCVYMHDTHLFSPHHLHPPPHTQGPYQQHLRGHVHNMTSNIKHNIEEQISLSPWWAKSDRSTRPGIQAAAKGVEPLYNVVIVPGFVTSGLELWSGELPCSYPMDHRQRVWCVLYSGVLVRAFCIRLYLHLRVVFGCTCTCAFVCVCVQMCV